MIVAENKPPISVEGLHKTFGSQNVLNGIDLTVDRGETVAVIGRSGAGKSVLLRLLVGIERADSGSVRVLGEDLGSLAPQSLDTIRKKIGFLFQQGALYDSLTIEQNVAFPLARHAKLSALERRDRARKLLASVGLERISDKMPSEISGGMQKRVALARALALEPEILMFDEPTAGLDPITGAEIGDLIVKLKEQRPITSLVVTHDVRVSRRFADRFVLLEEGVIRGEGSLGELQKSSDPLIIEFMRDAG